LQIALHTVLKGGHEADYDPFFDQPDSYEGDDDGLTSLWTLCGQLDDTDQDRQ
jgi:hypothetical protein